MIAIPLQFHISLDFFLYLFYNKDNKGKPLDGLPDSRFTKSNRLFFQGKAVTFLFWYRADHAHIRLCKKWHKGQQSLQTFLLLTWLSPPFLNISPPFFERLILSTRSYQLSEKANRLPFLLLNVVLTVYQKSTSYARTSVLKNMSLSVKVYKPTVVRFTVGVPKQESVRSSE